jgi:hypothetical protein
VTKQEMKSMGDRLYDFAKDIRVLIAALGLIVGGTGVKVMGDAGVTKSEAVTISDSVTKTIAAPLISQAKRQDTALMRIFFRQDVQMSDAQKRRADSLFHAALSNINYGGAQ